MAKNRSNSLSKKKFSGMDMLVAAIIFGLVGGLVGWAAFAAPHNGGSSGGKSSGTLNGPVMVTDLNHDGLPNWGDTITFSVTDSATWPSVQLYCTQNGSVVYNGFVGFYPTYPWGRNFTLSVPTWQSGAADCTAILYHTNKNGSNTTDATLKFHVSA